MIKNINPKINFLKKCKVCNGKKFQKLMAIKEQYLSSNFVKSNKNNSLKNIKTKLTLVMCKTKINSKICGHVQLKEIINQDLLYRRYFYRSNTSKIMRNDLKNVVDSVLNIIKPYEDMIALDIGSNDNTLLNFYPKKVRRFGFEPARNIKPIKNRKKINVINNYFNYKDWSKVSKKKPKIITSCAMFYDLPNPNLFVNDINKVIDEKGIWCVQISYLLSMIKNMNFYDICHEHLSYHSIDSMERLMANNNLKIFKIELNEVNGGSIRLYVCKKSCREYDTKDNLLKIKQLKIKEKKFKLKNKIIYQSFNRKIQLYKKKITNLINKIYLQNKKIIGLGASTKGNILLQHFGLNKKHIPFISERNKEKVGLKCIGTDIKLISEKSAREMKPDYMLVLPWYFKKEIVIREKKYLQKGGKLLFPMPYPHLITYNKEIKL